MPREVCQPFTVLDVGLAARHVLDVVRIADDDVERVLKEDVHRTPVDTGPFERDMRHPFGQEPLAHVEQLSGDGAKGLRFLLRPLVWCAHEHRGYYSGLAHIHVAHPLENRLHRRLPVGHRGADGKSQILLCVLPQAPGCDKRWSRKSARVSLDNGVVSHQRRFVRPPRDRRAEAYPGALRFSCAVVPRRGSAS